MAARPLVKRDKPAPSPRCRQRPLRPDETLHLRRCSFREHQTLTIIGHDSGCHTCIRAIDLVGNISQGVSRTDHNIRRRTSAWSETATTPPPQFNLERATPTAVLLVSASEVTCALAEARKLPH